MIEVLYYTAFTEPEYIGFTEDEYLIFEESRAYYYHFEDFYVEKSCDDEFYITKTYTGVYYKD